MKERGWWNVLRNSPSVLLYEGGLHRDVSSSSRVRCDFETVGGSNAYKLFMLIFYDFKEEFFVECQFFFF